MIPTNTTDKICRLFSHYYTLTHYRYSRLGMLFEQWMRNWKWERKSKEWELDHSDFMVSMQLKTLHSVWLLFSIKVAAEMTVWVTIERIYSHRDNIDVSDIHNMTVLLVMYYIYIIYSPVLHRAFAVHHTFEFSCVKRVWSDGRKLDRLSVCPSSFYRLSPDFSFDACVFPFCAAGVSTVL